MLLAFSTTLSLLLLAAAGAAGWGLACGLFEQVALAPQRRLSLLGPAYAPAMTLAFLAGLSAVIDENGVRFGFALFLAIAFFLLGAAFALMTFRATRWILRTRFSIDTTKPTQ